MFQSFEVNFTRRIIASSTARSGLEPRNTKGKPSELSDADYMIVLIGKSRAVQNVEDAHFADTIAISVFHVQFDSLRRRSHTM
jgi:hypothetical protein